MIMSVVVVSIYQWKRQQVKMYPILPYSLYILFHMIIAVSEEITLHWNDSIKMFFFFFLKLVIPCFRGRRYVSLRSKFIRKVMNRKWQSWYWLECRGIKRYGMASCFCARAEREAAPALFPLLLAAWAPLTQPDLCPHGLSGCPLGSTAVDLVHVWSQVQPSRLDQM